MKRQEDEGDADPSIEELCHDRPADEYFRLNTDGDCRDVVRYVHGFLFKSLFIDNCKSKRPVIQGTDIELN